MGQNVFFMFFVIFKEKNAPASLLVQYGWSPCWACWARCNQDVIKKKIYCFEKKPSSSKRKSNIWKAVCINTNKPAEKCDILQKQFWFIVLLTFIKNWLWRGLQVLWFIAWFINASKLLWYLTWHTKTLLCFSRIHRADEEAKKRAFLPADSNTLPICPFFFRASDFRVHRILFSLQDLPRPLKG